MLEKNRLRNEILPERPAILPNRAGKKPISRTPKVARPIDPRLFKLFGLFLLLSALFLLLSFISYLIDWSSDQSVLQHISIGKLLSASNYPVHNWMGMLGALASWALIYKGFGIASFAFVYMLVVLGTHLLFKEKIFHLGISLGNSLFFLLFISLLTAFLSRFASNEPQFLGGVFGYQSIVWLNGTIGWAGTAALLIFTGLGWGIFVFNLELNLTFFKVRDKDLSLSDQTDYSNQEASQDDDFFTPAPSLKVKSTIKPNAEPLIIHHLNDDEITIYPAGPDDNEDDDDQENKNAHEPYKNKDPKKLIKDPELAIQLIIKQPEPEKRPLDSLKNPLSVFPSFSVERTENEKKSADLVQQFGKYDETLDLASYKFPTLELLEDYGSQKIQVSAAELEANKNKIVSTLGHYDIGIEKIKATIGPTVTLYEIIPKAGVRISKIKNLEDDIALNLAALGIRIIAPIPGKGTIGIEVPNQQPELVSMRSVISSEKYQRNEMELPIAFGKTISNEVFVADLAKMPHLLMAGATGQGKSVGINALLVSLLYKKHPSQLKFVLVDPKKVELTLFRKIERHFLAKLPNEEEAIITDTKKVINTLNSLCIEMDQRYTLLKDAAVRNLKEYNQKFVNRQLNPEEGHRYLPFIVLVIDEFADLMMTAGKEIEAPIARLAQLARAIGIHLVIATQRPSVNIITGTIKANFPARIAFRVTSKVDSRTILDASGADQLIGRGDMLLSTGSEIIRLQCAFVDTPEVERITDFIGSQRGYASALALPEYEGEENESSSKGIDLENRDSNFEDAAWVVVLHQQGSTSLIQRKLKLGYNRAGRIMDELEAAKIVGPFEGSKARQVLYPDEYSLEQFLENLNKK